MSGAVDLNECRTRTPRRGCRCEKCVVCGFHKHTAIHGPCHGQPAGSRPWGHEFVSAAEAFEASSRGEGEPPDWRHLVFGDPPSPPC